MIREWTGAGGVEEEGARKEGGGRWGGGVFVPGEDDGNAPSDFIWQDVQFMLHCVAILWVGLMIRQS